MMMMMINKARGEEPMLKEEEESVGIHETDSETKHWVFKSKKLHGEESVSRLVGR